jgi:lipopolysaccharide/colanic/teichoic acid biosynthesis glycosyltransferase
MNHYELRKADLSMNFPLAGTDLDSLAPEAKAGRPDDAAGLDSVYAVDLVAATLLLLLCLPVLLLAMAWVLLVDGGNPIFVQTRVGLNGKEYRLFKIRSMRRETQEEDRFCAHQDERILPGGKFLRRTRIDELPQLLNVLMGQMALIGPRPEQPSFVHTFQKEIPSYQQRHRVKPGITGLAQIVQGYVDDTRGTRLKLKYDLLFIRNRSLKLWFTIAFRTVRVVFFGHGAR